MIGSPIYTRQEDLEHATPETIESRFITSVHHFVLSQTTDERLSICRHLLSAVREHMETEGEISGETGFWQLTSEAWLFSLEDNVESAVEHFCKAQAMAESEFGQEHYLIGVSLGNIAELHYALGQYEDCNTLLERAFEILEVALSDNEGLPLESYLAHALAEVVRTSRASLKALSADREESS